MSLFLSSISLHPGEVLADELLAREEVKSAFAMRIGIYPSDFSDLLKGKRNISASIAVRLEKELNIPAEFWLGLEMDYDLHNEREKIALIAGFFLTHMLPYLNNHQL